MNLLVLSIVGGSLALAEAPEPASKSADPQSQLAKIKEESQKAMSAAMKAVAAGGSETEMEKIKKDVSATLAGLHRRALELAAKNPSDPVAFQALVWVVEHRGPDGMSPEMAQAIAILAREHATSDQIGQLCWNLDTLDSAETEHLLLRVSDVNPSKDIRARALHSLGILLHHRADACHEADPKRAEGCLAESQNVLRLVAADYGDVKVGSRAMRERVADALDEIRLLSIGKSAPEIEGEDGDGKKFRLSDYKGKVVVLDFWAGW
jgi:hypothetical protein